MVREQGRPPATAAAYRRDVRRVAQDLPALLHAPDKIEAQSLADWRDAALAAGQPAATVARRLAALRAFYRHLLTQGRVTTNPAQAVAVPSPPPPAPSSQQDPMEAPLPPARIVEILGQLQDEAWLGARDALLVSLIHGAGLRLSEALSLRCADVSREAVLTLREREVAVSLTPALHDPLHSYRRLCPFAEAPERAFFLGTRGGPLNPGVAQRQLRRARQALGLGPTMTASALRRSFAMQRLAEGVDDEDLRADLGLRHRHTARRYRRPG